MYVAAGLAQIVQVTHLDVLTSATDVRKHCRLDVAVLRPQNPNHILTTPESSIYRNCQPLWCNVPKTKSVHARCQVLAGGYAQRTASLDGFVQAQQSKTTALNVMIAPEPFTKFRSMLLAVSVAAEIEKTASLDLACAEETTISADLDVSIA
jgi:hypothetical protein